MEVIYIESTYYVILEPEDGWSRAPGSSYSVAVCHEESHNEIVLNQPRYISQLFHPLYLFFLLEGCSHLLVVKDVLLISHLNTFMGRLCPFVVKPVFSFSLNCSVPSPFLAQESIFKRAVITHIYRTELYYTFWLIYTGPLRL